MSHDSTAAPDAAARKLSGRRRKEIVAVLLFSGGPIFESSIPLSVFGIDRQDAGVPRYRLLVAGGEEGPLRTTGGLELTAPYGLEAISRAAPSSCRPGGRSPHRRRRRRWTHCAAPTRKAPASSGCAPAPSSWPPPDCWTAGPHHTWMYAPTLAKRYPSVHVDPRELFVDDGDVLTSAGTAAGIDLCLHIVRTDHGNEAAGALARRLVVPPRRSGGQERYLDRSLPEEIGADPLAEVVAWALEHLHEQFRGDARGTRVHEPADVRPTLPLAHGQRAAAVADHPAGAPGTAAAGDLRLLGRRGRRALRIPLAGRAARALPAPARLVARAYRAAYRARRPQGDRPGDTDGTGGTTSPQVPQEAAPLPMQTRRTAAASALGPSASVSTDNGKHVPELYAAGRGGLPGQRSAH